MPTLVGRQLSFERQRKPRLSAASQRESSPTLSRSDSRLTSSDELLTLKEESEEVYRAGGILLPVRRRVHTRERPRRATS